MPSIFQRLFEPGLPLDWSRRVRGGLLHQQDLKDRHAARLSATSAASRAMANLDVLPNLVVHTAQAAVATADLIAAAPVNAFGAGVMVVTGAAGLASGLARGLVRTVLGREQTGAGVWSAAKFGADMGYRTVRCAYTFAARVALDCCFLLAAPIHLALLLPHIFTPIASPKAACASDYKAVPMNRAKQELESLAGPGGIGIFITNLQVTPGANANSLDIRGDIKGMYGLMQISALEGTVTGDGDWANKIRLSSVDSLDGKPFEVTYKPSTLFGRPHMTGAAFGFPYSWHSWGAYLLRAEGYDKVQGPRTQAQPLGFHSDDEEPVGAKFLRPSRNLDDGAANQLFFFSETWHKEDFGGPVRFQNFPLAHLLSSYLG